MHSARRILTEPTSRWIAFNGREALAVDFAGDDRPGIVTQVLAACRAVPGDSEEIWRLPISWRIAALCEIVGLTEGEVVLAHSLRCPAPGCGEPFEVELPFHRLIEADAHSEATIAVDTSGSGTLRLRLPTGADQRSWRGICWSSRQELVVTIIVTLLVEGPTEVLGSFTPDDIQRIAEALEAGDPLVAFSIECVCPACDAALRLPVDLEVLALGRLAAAQRRLIHAVHRLALHYGWTEAEILGLPDSRRREYLRLIEKEAA